MVLNGLESAVQIAQRALLVAATISLPVLGTALAVGLFFSMLQAMSQVHEQTLSFIPKLLVTGAVLFFLVPWLLSVMTSYTREVLELAGSVGSW